MCGEGRGSVSWTMGKNRFSIEIPEAGAEVGLTLEPACRDTDACTTSPSAPCAIDREVRWVGLQMLLEQAVQTSLPYTAS